MSSERSSVEAYIKQHGVQGLLDDLVDRVVTAKPADPLEYMVGVLREKMQSGITSVKARAIFGAGAAPTVEVEVETRAGVCTASAPAGDSSHAARDYEARRVEANEASVGEAVVIINEQIAPRLLGCDPTDQRAMDELLMPLRADLGANAMIAVSMAICRAGARAKDVSLFRHIAELAGNHEELVLPVPVVTALSAGRRAGSASAALPFREFLLLPTGASSVREALSVCNAVTNAIKVTLTGGVAGAPIGDEGTPALEDAVPRYELLSSTSGSAAVPANVTTAQQTFDLLRGCMGQLGLVDKIRLGVNASAQDFATTFSAGGIAEGEDAMDASHLPVIYKLAGPDEEGSDVEELTVRCVAVASRLRARRTGLPARAPRLLRHRAELTPSPPPLFFCPPSPTRPSTGSALNASRSLTLRTPSRSAEKVPLRDGLRSRRRWGGMLPSLGASSLRRPQQCSASRLTTARATR